MVWSDILIVSVSLGQSVESVLVHEVSVTSVLVQALSQTASHWPLPASSGRKYDINKYKSQLTISAFNNIIVIIGIVRLGWMSNMTNHFFIDLR